MTRAVKWPENAFFTVRFEGRDLVVLRGIEPSYRWRSFCNAVLAVVRETGCEMVVTFGALLADVPHTRKVRITGTATDPELIRRLDLAQLPLRGTDRHRRRPPRRLPRGRRALGVVVGAGAALHRGASEPAGHAGPARTVRLPARPATSTSTGSRTPSARGASESTRSRATTTTCASYVQKLEERYDAEEQEGASWGDDLPSGEELASELERFLREQRGDR